MENFDNRNQGDSSVSSVYYIQHTENKISKHSPLPTRSKKAKQIYMYLLMVQYLMRWYS